MNLGNMLTQSATAHADMVALVHNGRKILYRELEAAACALANHLKSEGLDKGDKVALMLPNIPEFPIVYFAERFFVTLTSTVLTFGFIFMVALELGSWILRRKNTQH